MADILIRTENGNEINEYGGRHGIALTSYEAEYLEKWKKLTTGEAYVCIAGRHVTGTDHEVISSHTRFNWIYDRLKTKKGCASYFTGDC